MYTVGALQLWFLW